MALGRFNKHMDTLGTSLGSMQQDSTTAAEALGRALAFVSEANDEYTRSVFSQITQLPDSITAGCRAGDAAFESENKAAHAVHATGILATAAIDSDAQVIANAMDGIAQGLETGKSGVNSLHAEQLAEPNSWSLQAMSDLLGLMQRFSADAQALQTAITTAKTNFDNNRPAQM
jgi:hypothetical protein